MKRAILVKSCRRFRARQEAIDASWRRGLQCLSVPVWIAYGYGVGPSVKNESWNELYCTGGDAYQDNSRKVSEALKLLLNTDFTHLFICDDDTFVHSQRWLAHEPQGEFECRLYHPRSANDHKLNGGRPWAHGGAGWWMSRRVCELYVKEVTERCSWDDVLATKIAQKHGIEISDRPDLYAGDRYSGEAGQRVAADNALITSHHVRPSEMVQLYEATRDL